MTRHARMRGHPTLLLPGLDHASIAAQFVMDGILAKEGEDRRSLGRERYLERIRAFSDSTKPVMLGQQRRVGGSFDWGRLRYTMDEGSAKAVRVAFERLYRDDLAYRTEALVNWCPGCRTSVSDLEVVATPETGTLWTIRYHLIDEATGVAGPGCDDLDRHDPPRDAAGRHGGGRPSRRPALRRARRPAGAHPVRGSRRADHRRRDGRPRVRDGRGQDHAGPRPRRPRDGAASRAAVDHDPRRRRHDRRDRDRLRRARPVRGPSPDRRRPRRDGRPRGQRGPRDGRRPLPAQLGHRRAAAQDAMVHPDGSAGGPGARRDAVRPDADPAGPLREDLGALADHDPRLEREPPAVVGPPHPGLVLPGRARDGHVAGGRAGRLRGLRPAGGRAHPGPRHLRHLVQLRPVAVLDPRLARRHPRLPALLPDVGDGDGLRHHLLLGRPDDDAGPPPHRSRAVPHRLPLGADPRPRGPEDVEDEGQRRRPARA